MTNATHKKVLANTARQHNCTVQAVALKSGTTPHTARRHLDLLVAENLVVVTGCKNTGKRGRPAKLYRRA